MKVGRWGGLFLGLIFSTSAFAVELDQRLQIHGFGGWDYGKTNENHYQGGNEEGEYHHSQFAVSLSAEPQEGLRIAGQFEFEQGEEEIESELDFVFAEWTFSDLLRFRIGKVKQPFGIYTEIFDVGTVRPFLSLPAGFYGASGIVAEGFNGIGFTGEYLTSGGWALAYDLYGGELIVGDSHPWGVLEVPPPMELEEEEHLADLIGGRATLVTPWSGLSMGLSAYSGKPEAEEGEPDPGTTTVYGAHLEYLSAAWSVRSEYAHKKEGDGLKQQAAYGEVAYRLTSHWQMAGRYDWGKADPPEVDLSPAPSLVDHKDWAVALNYWFNPHFVLKAEYHWVDGNRFAIPEDPADVAAAAGGGELETKTQLIRFGAHFSF